MAANKTLAPSQRKLRKAREDGDVAKSRDASTSIMLTACYLYMFFCWNPIIRLSELFSGLSSSLADFHSNNMLVYAVEAGLVLFELLAPLLVLLFASAFVAEASQVGFQISFKSLMPDLKKLSFFRGLRRILGIPQEGQGGSTAFRLLYEIGKMALLLFLAFGLLFIHLKGLLPQLAMGSPDSSELIVAHVDKMFRPLLTYIILLSAAIGAVDLLLQRKRRFERLRMDINEFRKEMRESEGDPELRGMRKQLFQENIFGNSLNAIRKAKVVILGRREVR